MLAYWISFLAFMDEGCSLQSCLYVGAELKHLGSSEDRDRQET